MINESQIKIISWIMLALSVVFAVVAFFVLPDTVVTQFSVNNSYVTTMPKIVAILIPFVLGAGGALFTVAIKGEERSKHKGLIVSAVGIIVFVIMLAVNLK